MFDLDYNYDEFGDFVFNGICKLNEKFDLLQKNIKYSLERDKIKHERLERKKKVIANNVYEIYKNWRYANYSLYCSENYENCYFNEKFTAYLNDEIFIGLATYEDIAECERIFDATRARVSRLKKRITKMLEFDCIFLTYTFRNDVLNNNSIDSLKQYVRKHLKLISNSYVGNIDFGSKNNRVHFHALVVADNVDFSTWRFGALNGKRVVNKNSSALSKYIAKLTNHAIKETTKGCRIIYSRCTWT